MSCLHGAACLAAGVQFAEVDCQADPRIETLADKEVLISDRNRLHRFVQSFRKYSQVIPYAQHQDWSLLCLLAHRRNFALARMC